MTTGNIDLPDPLLEKVREAAAEQEISPDEFVRGAVEERLSRGEWRKTLEFGHRNARDRGIRPEDVDAEIDAERAKHGR
jgi:hypothetical protein